MVFQPGFTDGRPFAEPLGKIVCVGRNYAAHARELNNEVPTAPLLFIKPASSATPMRERIRVPRHLGEVHFETEVALLIGRRLCRAQAEDVPGAIAGVGLALDLTLRDVQSRLKDKGHPWERAKGFDGACPISEFVPFDPEQMALNDLCFSLIIDGERRQTGHTAMMLFNAVDLIREISRSFTLEPGDVVLTGTPEGVGALPEGGRLVLSLDGHFEVTARS